MINGVGFVFTKGSCYSLYLSDSLRVNIINFVIYGNNLDCYANWDYINEVFQDFYNTLKYTAFKICMLLCSANHISREEKRK